LIGEKDDFSAGNVATDPIHRHKEKVFHPIALRLQQHPDYHFLKEGRIRRIHISDTHTLQVVLMKQ
jgi:hypothetical protein